MSIQNAKISNDDELFCQQHQAAFDQSGTALRGIAGLIKASIDEQQRLLNDHDKHFQNPYMCSDWFDCNSATLEQLHKTIRNRNVVFIESLVDYFSNKYAVNLDFRPILKKLIPAEPQPIETPYRSYIDMDDAERASFDAALEKYKQDTADYHYELEHLPIKYPQVVAEIIGQLDGMSFEDRAMNDFLSKVWDSCHVRWGNHNETFTLSADVIRFENGCRCRTKDWEKPSVTEFIPMADMGVIFEALNHFEFGTAKDWRDIFGLSAYHGITQNVFVTGNMKKVHHIRFYKNSRVDIRFTSAQYAQEFIANYLRRKSL